MAKAATNRWDTMEVPMIEEQVETGLSELLRAYTPNYVPGGDKKDDLLKRFTLYPNRALPEFDHAYAKGYEAQDDFNHSRRVYALVLDPLVPYRHQAITELNGFICPTMVPLLGAGTVNCSHLGEARQVLFFERPSGPKLSEVIKNQTRLHEHQVVDFVMNPVGKALLAMRDKNIHHGNICPNTVFVGDDPKLGECASAPCGTQGHYLYEPIERMMCDPLGHGEASEKTDMYALGILAYELMYGLEKFKSIPREDFIKRVMQTGTHAVFAGTREFPDQFQDFFRGVLNDNPAERWGLDQLAQWLNGKRFNMIAPQPPKDATRPFTFATENFLSRRVLANAFHRNWREAVKDARVAKLDRWCEAGLHRPELAEAMERALRIGGDTPTEKQNSDMMARVICLLDPVGPLRSLSLSLRPDAIGIMLADIIRHEGTELPQLLNFIEADLGSFWAEQSEANKSLDMANTIFRLQKVRAFLKRPMLGFGLERVLYELNPALSCQSPLVKRYHVMTALDMLKTLDALAPQLSPDTRFDDAHIAAFIAAKIDMGKAVRMDELSIIPALMNNPELIAMRILARAQGKYKKLELVGLCAWAAQRIEKMIDEIHNRVIRRRLKLQLKGLANTGNLNEVLGIIINPSIIQRDYNGFTHAIALHEINYKRIEVLNNPLLLEYKAKKTGGRMAMMISYTALVIVSFLTLTDSLGI